MNSAIKVQKFLKNKLEENRIRKKTFALESGIPYSTLCKIINGAQRNTELKTIVKIADYFNCAMDEVTGRSFVKRSEETKFNKLSTEEIGVCLKKFLNNKLTELSLNSYQLAKKSGFSDVALYEFMQDNTIKKSLGSSMIIGLADYLNVSLDVMTGRVAKPEISLNTAPKVLEGFSHEDLKKLKLAKNSLGLNVSKHAGAPVPNLTKRNKPSLTK